MKARALALPLFLVALAAAPQTAAAQTAAPPAAPGEPLPAGAPTQPYELAAWCYGAMSEYLTVYERVIPDLRDIDRTFGSSVKNEAQPYAADMAAAHDELKVLAAAVEAAEKASPQVISTDGAAAVVLGRSIWSPAETHTKRELARAWLSWALPDACDANARSLKARSDLLGQALKYNVPSATASPPAPVTTGEDTPPPSPAAPTTPSPQPQS